jgi:hypothetical protein
MDPGRLRHGIRCLIFSLIERISHPTSAVGLVGVAGKEQDLDHLSPPDGAHLTIHAANMRRWRPFFGPQDIAMARRRMMAAAPPTQEGLR